METCPHCHAAWTVDEDDNVLVSTDVDEDPGTCPFCGQGTNNLPPNIGLVTVDVDKAIDAADETYELRLNITRKTFPETAPWDNDRTTIREARWTALNLCGELRKVRTFLDSIYS